MNILARLLILHLLVAASGWRRVWSDPSKILERCVDQAAKEEEKKNLNALLENKRIVPGCYVGNQKDFFLVTFRFGWLIVHKLRNVEFFKGFIFFRLLVKDCHVWISAWNRTVNEVIWDKPTGIETTIKFDKTYKTLWKTKQNKEIIKYLIAPNCFRFGAIVSKLSLCSFSLFLNIWDRSRRPISLLKSQNV